MISQSVEYALRAMLYLASFGEASLTSETIASGTKVPAGYLSKVMRDLVVADLVISQRGPKGGFSLARSPGTISMLDIVNAVNPILRIRVCPVGNPEHVRLCPLHARIDRAMAHVEEEFRRATLADMLTDTTPGDCRRMTKAPQQPTINRETA